MIQLFIYSTVPLPSDPIDFPISGKPRYTRGRRHTAERPRTISVRGLMKQPAFAIYRPVIVVPSLEAALKPAAFCAFTVK